MYKLIDNHPVTYIAENDDDLTLIAEENYNQRDKSWSFGVLVVMENGQAKILHDDGSWHTFG